MIVNIPMQWVCHTTSNILKTILQAMELFSRRWRLASAQLSNKFGYCPWCTVSIVLYFHKHNNLPLGYIRAFISHKLPRSPFNPGQITVANCTSCCQRYQQMSKCNFLVDINSWNPQILHLPAVSWRKDNFTMYNIYWKLWLWLDWTPWTSLIETIT